MRCRKTNAGRLGIGQHRNAFRTECEINADNEIKEESALHDKVIAFCNRNALGYVHSRMDKRPTIRKGWPDCTVCRRHDGRTLVAFVELKTARGRLTKDQESVIAEMTALGVPVHVCRSYKAATDAIANELYL